MILVMVEDAGTTRGDPQLRVWVEQAFEKAKDSGRPEWWRMTLGVLKNRILTASDGSFAESHYGAANMIQLAQQLSDLLMLDSTSKPPQVVLRAAAPDTSAEPQTTAVDTVTVPNREFRIRRDLWDAVVDFASAEVYVWDGTGASKKAPEKDDLILPTIDEDVEKQWRTDFTSEHLPRAQLAETEALTRWRDSRLRTSALPGRYRGEWNNYLKSKVVERLTHWFSEQGIEPPANLTERHPRQLRVSDEAALRRSVLRCVNAMTEGELSALMIPATVVSRLLTKDVTSPREER